MMPPGWTPLGYWGSTGRKARRSFLSGFTGCLGVAATIIIVLVVLLLVRASH
jgi:hypothetical protein